MSTVSVKDAVIEVAVAHFRDMLTDKYKLVHDDAIDAFRDADEQGTPRAKVTFSFAWNPMAAVPQIDSQISWPVRRKFATSDAADPNQIKLPLDGKDGAA